MVKQLERREGSGIVYRRQSRTARPQAIHKGKSKSTVVNSTTE